MASTTNQSGNASVQDIREKILNREENQAFIDVRTPGEFRGSQIGGFENVPLSDVDKQANRLAAFCEVYVSCHNGLRTQQAVQKLQQRGINAIPVDGGIVAWRKAGFPLIEGKKGGGGGAIPVMRQIQIIFGILVLSGLALSHFVHPYFIGITAFVGVALMIAGSTGWCGFAMMLDKLPWNR